MKFLSLPARVFPRDSSEDYTSAKTLAEHTLKEVKSILIELGTVPPGAVLVFPDRLVFIRLDQAFLRKDTKLVAAKSLRRLCELHQPEGIALVFEAWMSSEEKTEKVECLGISAEWKGEPPVWRMAQLERDTQGNLIRLIERDDEQGCSLIEGNFGNLLGQEIES